MWLWCHLLYDAGAGDAHNSDVGGDDDIEDDVGNENGDDYGEADGKSAKDEHVLIDDAVNGSSDGVASDDDGDARLRA